MSVQYVTVASQKLTCPTEIAEAPEFAAAVSVTTVPETTVVTALPPEVIVSVVVVAAGVPENSGKATQKNVTRAAEVNNGRGILTFISKLQSRPPRCERNPSTVLGKSNSAIIIRSVE